MKDDPHHFIPLGQDSRLVPKLTELPKPQLARILLSKAASDALNAAGERAFAIVHRCMRGVEAPETAGRWCITLAPVEWETAQDASAVLLGTKRAAPLRKGQDG